MLSMHKLAKRSLQFQLKINDNFQFDTIDGEITNAIMRRQNQAQVNCIGDYFSIAEIFSFGVQMTQFSVINNANFIIYNGKQIVLIL